MLKHTILFAAVAGLVLALAPAAQAAPLGMEFVPIGNAPNADDDTGYGGVDYQYNIGKYEVTTDEWNASGVGGGYGPYWTGSQPAVNVSWHEAAQFANWMTTEAGGTPYYIDTGGGIMSIPSQSHYDYAQANGLTYFIPTEDEWYKAAYYDGSGTYYDYPTGSDSAPTATSGSTNPDEAVYNQSAPADVDNAGGLSPYGTMGQGGNVWEWNEALIGSSRGYRGGAWGFAAVSTLHASTRGSIAPTDEYYTVGFRVSEVVPEPATMCLLALGGLGLVLGRKRR